MRDIRQSKFYAEYLSRIGWEVEKVGEIYAFVKKLPLGLSAIKVQRPEELRDEDIKRLSELRKNYRAFQTTIEPKTNKHSILITKHGFRISKSPYLPTKTLHLDLTLTKEELFNQLKKDAKYSLKKTRDLRICSIDKIDKFHKSWRQSVGFKRYVPSKKNLNTLLHAFKNNSLFLVTSDGSAGAIFLNADKCTYYWQAFSSKKGREALAQYKIVWSGILWAKEKGAKIFDFEGTYDPRFPQKSWLGFTHFKKSFGGFEVEFPGAFMRYNIFR